MLDIITYPRCYYIIALSKILNTLYIILHLVWHKPTKWFSDNQHWYNIYIYIIFDELALKNKN